MHKSLQVFALLLVAVALPVIFANTPASTKIAKSVLSKLEESKTVDIFLSFNGGTTEVIKKFSESGFRKLKQTRQSRIESLVTTLETHAETSQKSVVEFLNKSKNFANISIQSFWISNQIFVRGANAELIYELAELDDIVHINLNQFISLEPWNPIPASGYRLNEEVAWGIDNVRAPEVWNLADGGITGEGVIIAIIDSGVRGSHITLRDNFIGMYGWYDPIDGTMTPNDQQGHGSHVAGTILGTLGIGVAPNAKWMACKASNPQGQMSDQALLECGQFVLCPTFPDGSNRDCSKAPHIVSNSWGGMGGENDYASTIAAWHLADIIPVFAMGNEGDEGCSSGGSPGDLPNVISVGATDQRNGIAYFSSRGPAINDYKRIKPEITAPGVDIWSASHLTDDDIVLMDGTSMACPHVSGGISLMKSIHPELSFEEVKSYLFQGVDRKVIQIGNVCGGIPDYEFPNNFYGEGKMDIYESVVKLVNDLKTEEESGGNILQAHYFLCFAVVISSICSIF